MPGETALIQPLPVERDTDGWWPHPDYTGKRHFYFGYPAQSPEQRKELRNL
ncbi:hypothetical protein PS854_03340 [Pseudomonas fluorescens]|uniref:Uncharacterized protein n=1 Tax=Pseudomonas fluorescens TaxID=294 RepID=A0A5E7LJR6_PSEFL|nr:hypothetical protein PS854_03340 [Pseudomonas fluorescens]